MILNYLGLRCFGKGLQFFLYQYIMTAWHKDFGSTELLLFPVCLMMSCSSTFWLNNSVRTKNCHGPIFNTCLELSYGHRTRLARESLGTRLSVNTFAVSKNLIFVEHADTPRTSLALIWAWKIVTDCLGNLSTSAKLPTNAITIDFVICIGLD